MINKIQKAGEYASQPERATFNRLRLQFNGANSSYLVSLSDDGWSCTCAGFQKYAICPHIMALESLFKPMLKRRPLPYAPGQNIVSDVTKAKRYSQEIDRIHLISFECSFEGYNKTHTITYDQGHWTSTASFFAQRGVCSHTMALEKILKGFVEPVRVQPAV
ncbi:MAG: SWIM zinc finger domain-containing protein [Chloroflexota bacterium]|nr:SWIM zinc finger domain-containing protein [Chloroflexota bacterium]MDE2909842.1 SWIM zinc finger domain-containing protein [Chloroflexota bacterium]